MPSTDVARPRSRSLPLALALVVVAACGGSGAAGSAPLASPTETVAGVGRLPETIPPATLVGEAAEEIPVDVTLPPIEGEEIGTVATGHRLLMVGDSLFAGVSRRFSNKACEQLTPLGWDVLVEAEPGRFIDFGRRVLDRRWEEGWDALVLMFGSNYRFDREGFSTTLGSMIDDAGDVPVVLLTTSLFREAQREVNEVIASYGALLEHVTVIDWERISAIPGVLSRDRIHPTDQGQQLMVAAIAQVLGEAPDGPDGERGGECLRPQFTDDSAIGRGTGTGTPPPSPATTRPPSTSPPVPSTSAPPSTQAPAPTDPPATAPPATAPPGTEPPSTSPPATAPPATAPPPPPPSDPPPDADG